MEIKKPSIVISPARDVVTGEHPQWIEYKYCVKGIFPSEGVRSCENCGQVISWYAVLVENAKNEVGSHNLIRVGVDCAATLAKTMKSGKKFSVARARKIIKEKVEKTTKK